jgi:hypothetical protein
MTIVTFTLRPLFYFGIATFLPNTLGVGYFVLSCFYLLSPNGHTLKHLSFATTAIVCASGHADR